MRVTTAFNRLLDLDGVNVAAVDIRADEVVVHVRLRRRRLACPLCEHTTGARYDTRRVESVWRHLRLATLRLVIKAQLRRLDCPEHGVRVEGVDFARPGARFTRDFEQLVAWLATKMDKTAVRRLVQVDWATVGRICERVVADELDPGRLDGLFDIGVDEISWRKHHNYLTLVVNHQTNKVVWGGEGRSAATLDGFFDELGAARSGQIRAVSMDMGPAFRKSVLAEGHAPQATICFDPFHAVKLVTDALNVVRRQHWNRLRQLDDADAARTFKGARWALLKNPDKLTDKQAAALATIRRGGGETWRGYRLKEAFRAIFAGDLTVEEAEQLLDRWTAWAQRSRLPSFVKAQRTIRQHRQGILDAIRLGLTNARLEGLNQRVRLIHRRAFGFHTAGACLALVMLSAGPINLVLPWEPAP